MSHEGFIICHCSVRLVFLIRYLRGLMGTFNETADKLMESLSEIADKNMEANMLHLVNCVTLEVITKVLKY